MFLGKKNLMGSTALLTGAGGGMGQEFTKQLLNEGVNLILTDIDENRLKKISAGIEASSQNPTGKIKTVIGADISKEEDIKKLYERIKENSLFPDILIMNAGLLIYGDFQDTPKDRWEELMNVNLIAPMRITYLFLPELLKRGRGNLVYISSIAGVVGTTQSATYSASKFGLRGFALSLNGEVSKKGITVTIVYPFWINTPLLNMPTFTKDKPKTLKYFYIYTPEKIVRIIIKAIKKGKLQVFPGIIPKIINFVNKFYPVVGSQRIK